MRTVREFAGFSGFLRRNYVARVSRHPGSDDLSRILATYPRLVVAMNHGPMAGPLAGSVGIMNQYYKSGGADRKPVIIAWRGFYKIPFIKHVVRYMSQVKTPPNLDGFVRRLTEGDATDLFVMPEGENCSFGNGLDIEPFLSPRFVELALKAGTPIMIAVHVGSERWSNIMPVSERLDPILKYLPRKSYERIRESGQVNLNLTGLKKLPELKMYFKLYHPAMTREDLARNDCEQLLAREADRIRELMQTMVDEVTNTGGNILQSA
ncbi:MAG: hypothetical protein R3208_00900 [Ketobacteraceae bacterium]|nr:hypothetical protein [Ketobacteraceae bacterium]